MRLRLAPVEYKECHTDNCKRDKRRYEGEKCPWCKSAFDPLLTLKISRDLLILISIPPSYERQAYVRCQNKKCKNLYSLDRCICPLCQTEKKKKLTSTNVWKRTFVKRISLDELKEREIIVDEMTEDNDKENDDKNVGSVSDDTKLESV